MLQYSSLPAANIQLMAEYNQWMNNNVYEAAATLAPSVLAEDRGAFFGSIIGTLNHILVGDTFWLKRFASHPLAFTSLDPVRQLDIPANLKTILYDDFNALHRARMAMDDVISDFSLEVPDEALSSLLSYSNTKGEHASKHFGYLIQHFFNHQTHHRGQISTLLYQAGVDIGVTDLLMSIPNE